MKPTFLITDADANTLSALPRKFRDFNVLAVALLMDDRTDFAAVEHLLKKFDAPVFIAARDMDALTEQCGALLALLPDETRVSIVTDNAGFAPLIYALGKEAPTCYYPVNLPANERLVLAADYLHRL